MTLIISGAGRAANAERLQKHQQSGQSSSKGGSSCALAKAAERCAKCPERSGGRKVCKEGKEGGTLIKET